MYLGLASILTILFVVFKVLGYIAWSWWIVFAPVWISAVIAIAVLVSILAVCVIAKWDDL